MINNRSREQVVVQEIEAAGSTNSYRSWIWKLLMTALLAGAGIIALNETWTTLAPSAAYLILTLAVSLLCCTGHEWLKQKYSQSVLFFTIPWIVALVVSRFGGYITGAKEWVNMLITRWNLAHDGGAALFTVNAGSRDVLAFTVLTVVLMTELVWIFITRHHGFLLGLYCLIWIMTGLISMTFRPFYGSMFILGLLGVEMAGRSMRISRMAVLWMAVLAAVFGISVVMVPTDDMQSGVAFRENVLECIHVLRYGEQTLPEGDLSQAATLKSSDEEMLKVRSKQDKTLYLRGFVGGNYQDGVWESMPESTYGGDNTGMLKWLKSKNFDPMTQVTEYYRLGTSEEAPEINPVSIQVTGAERDYIYLPGTVSQVTKGRVKKQKDSRFVSKGLTGIRKYSAEEISDSRPAELMVTEDWVNQPENDKQKQYLEAESVYRKFVYNHYTAVNEELQDILDEIFWSDYDSENDGIYSALTQVRKKMQAQITYTETPEAAPDGTDPIEWFLTESCQGNDMLYAAAATEALRAHGIPSRYVEGYYVGSLGASGNIGTLQSVTGKDSHAWVEVYFDGIGWLPVDVTPGYYYDAVSLQQMVSLPDGVTEKASLDDKSSETEQVTESNGGKKMPEKLKEIAVNMGAVILGVAAVMLIVLAILVIIAEILRIYIRRKANRIYDHASQEIRIGILEREIYSLMQLWGINVRLGWRTKEADWEATEIFDEVHPGEYSRICKLIEKSVYGDIALESYEERIVKNFRNKLKRTTNSNSKLQSRIRLRYEDIILYMKMKSDKRK